MAGEAKGQVGGLDMQEGPRKRLALESKAWRCQGCGGKSNEEILKEVEKEAQTSGEIRKEDTVPEELRMAYREDLGEKTIDSSRDSANPAAAPTVELGTSSSSLSLPKVSRHSDSGRLDSMPATEARVRILDRMSGSTSTNSARSAISSTTRSSPETTLRTHQSNHAATNTISREESMPAWIDKAITGLVFGLAFMILKKVLL